MREREGLTYAELSERCGLAVATLAWWSWRLRRDAKGSQGFSEVVIREGAELPAHARGRVIVRRGSIEVEIVEATADRIREVVAILDEQPC
jgi:hypothetical protein